MEELRQVLEPENETVKDVNISSEPNLNETKNSLEDINETPSEIIDEIPKETVELEPEEANTTNCVALTIQKDHKLVAVKNVFLRSIRMSWKVVVSTITLAILKLLS